MVPPDFQKKDYLVFYDECILTLPKNLVGHFYKLHSTIQLYAKRMHTLQKVAQLLQNVSNMCLCKVLYFPPLLPISFLPTFCPSPPFANCRFTPLTTLHHLPPPCTPLHNTTHTPHNVAQRQHTPLALGSAVATLRTPTHSTSTYTHSTHNLSTNYPQVIHSCTT